MRYVDVDSPHVEHAEALFERLVGYSLVSRVYSESGECVQGAFALSHHNVTNVLDVKGRTNDWTFSEVFGKTDWTPINLADVFTSSRKDATVVHIPPTLFGTLYTEADVTYEAGVKEAPQDVKDAILKIADLIASNEITEWNTNVPDDVSVVIERYRREVA